jgi:hypothetical protein
VIINNQEYLVPYNNLVFSDFCFEDLSSIWNTLTFTDICTIYINHLYRPEITAALSTFRAMGSKPIVFALVDDVHYFMKIRDEEIEGYNGLFRLLNVWTEFIDSGKTKVWEGGCIWLIIRLTLHFYHYLLEMRCSWMLFN